MGIISTPLPAQAWPGRVMIAKPVQSYSPAVNKMSVADNRVRAPQRVWLSRLPGTRDRKMLCETYRLRFAILAGLPITVTLGGTSRVTTLPAPTMASSPILTPGRMIVPPPIQTFLPMRTGMPFS